MASLILRMQRKLRQLYAKSLYKIQPLPLRGHINHPIVTLFCDFEGDYSLVGRTAPCLEAAHRMLDIQNRYNILFTYNTVALFASEIPHFMSKLIEHGHEVASHSKDHTVLSHLSVKQQDTNIKQAKQLFNSLNISIQGHRSPQSLWTLGVIRSLVKYGYRWNAENGSERYPYLLKETAGKRLWRMPVKGDDWLYIRDNYTPLQMLAYWKSLVNDAIRDSSYCAIGFHPWLENTEERLVVFEEFLVWLNQKKDINIMPFSHVTELLDKLSSRNN